MGRWTIMAALLSGLSFGAAASDKCAKIPDSKSRLACYDMDYRPTSEQMSDSQWEVMQHKSQLDDSPGVVISVGSARPIKDKFGRERQASLHVVCRENTTSLQLHFAGNFMSDTQGHGNVTYRLDSNQAQTASLNVSNDNKALGLWSGSQSIPVIKSFFGHDSLVVRALPFNESYVTATFPIAGIENAIKPLREACHW
jgi:type VI secretion system protein VasI